MSAGKSKADGKAKKNRQATTKVLLEPRILLGQQPAVGLFVLFAPIPTTLADAAGKSEGQAGAAAPASTTAPNVPAPPKFTACFIDGQGYPQTVSAGTNPWSEIADQLENLAVLRRKAKKGKGTGPIVAAKPCKNPHVFKLVDGASYKLCVVAHPNVELALAMQIYLNEGKSDPRFKFPKLAELVFEAKVQTDDDEGGKVAHIDLPVDPKRYWPVGHARYGGWVLYQDMPYAAVPAVVSAVSLLASDLATLRYPTGEAGNNPYPSASEHSGHFGLTMMATVHAFQKDAAAGNALKRMNVPLGDARKLSSSWPYLLAVPATSEDAKAKAALPVAGAAAVSAAVSVPAVVTEAVDKLAGGTATAVAATPAKDESEDIDWDWDWSAKDSAAKLTTEVDLGVGVVTAAVGDAIVKWKEAAYLKPGPILVQSNLQPRCWARPELAVALALWDLMAKALGCAYGIKLLCTFRELTVPAGVGRVECSNHKLGLSVDLLSSGLRNTHNEWPIHYEANWVPSPSSVTAAEDKKVKEAEAKVRTAEQKRAKADEYLKGLDQKKLDGKRVPSGAREAGESVLKQMIELEQEAKVELAAERANAHALAGRLDAAKANYYLCWRLYGHSSFKIWTTPKDAKNPAGEWDALSAAELQALLAGKDAFGIGAVGPWGIETRAADLVRGFFPATGDAAAKAAIESIVADVQTKARRIAKKLYRMAGEAGDKGLVANLFRRRIRPFVYNPFEADGGTSKPEHSVEDDDKLALAKAKFGATPIASYLNLTRLGFHCGMTRISAQRKVATGTFKRPNADPEYTPKVAPSEQVFHLVPPAGERDRRSGDIADMLSLLAGYLEDLAKAPEAGKPRVVLEDGSEQAVTPADLDIAFLRAWSKLMDVKNGPSFEDTSLSLALSADQAAFDARVAALAPVLGRKTQLVRAGKLLGVDAEVGKQATLKEWIDLAGRRRKQLFERAGNPGKSGPSKPKQLLDWSVVFFPLVGLGALDGKRVVRVVLPPCGAPAPLEWWHYDNKAMAGSWAEMAEAIGYSATVVRADDLPPATVVDGQYAGGLGFDPKKVDRVRTPPSSAPENWSKIPDGG